MADFAGGFDRTPQSPCLQQYPERRPEGAVFAGVHAHVQRLSPACAVHASGYLHSDVGDETVCPDLLGQSIHPHVRMGTAVLGKGQGRREGFVEKVWRSDCRRNWGRGAIESREKTTPDSLIDNA